MRVSSIFTGILLSVTLAAMAPAQETTTWGSLLKAFAARSSASITAIQSRPQGALAKNIDLGYGANATYLFRMDRAGFLSARADIGIARYGNESFRAPFSSTAGGRVQVDVSTDNYVVPFSLGAQVARPVGIIRPFINAGVGAVAFFTESSVSGTQANVIAASTNHSSSAASWVVGGGVLVPMTVSKLSVGLEGGVQYVSGRKTRYLAPGSITDLPGATTEVKHIEGTTHMMLLHLGVRVGR